MIQVLLYPDALSLVGSMNAFEIYNDSKTDVVFALRYQGAEQNIVQHTYTPNDKHRITVDVKDIILPLLAFELKDDSTPYIQENIMKAFSVEIYEVGNAGNKKEFSFSVIRFDGRILVAAICRRIADDVRQQAQNQLCSVTHQGCAAPR